jgi:hypothetical protein
VDYELGVDGLLADDEQMNNEFCTDDEDQEFWTDDDNKNSVHLMDDKDYRSFCASYKSPKPTLQGADDVGEERGNYVVSEEEEDNQEDDSDEDYVQPDSEDSSAEDEEAAELRKFAHDKKEG